MNLSHRRNLPEDSIQVSFEWTQLSFSVQENLSLAPFRLEGCELLIAASITIRPGKKDWWSAKTPKGASQKRVAIGDTVPNCG
jgi:hypothetical protein